MEFDMQKITITEIRKHLKAKGATLTKLKMRQALGGSSEDYSGFLDRIAETAYELGASMLDQREKWHD